MMPPHNRTIPELAREEGLSEARDILIKMANANPL